MEAFISFVVGIIVPYILQFVKAKNCDLQGWQVQLISIGAALVVSFVATIIFGQFNFKDWAGSAAICFGTTEAVYRLIIAQIQKARSNWAEPK